MHESVVIVDYDPNWPKLFEEEKARILDVLEELVVRIEHIGSTAVPGLGAKPIIDIMIGVEKLADAEKCIPLIERLGYEYVPEFEKDLPERRYFRKPPKGKGKRTHHLHMVETSSGFWHKQLLFVDYLKRHPEVAQEYHKLKKGLAARFKADRPAYTNAKSEFIEEVLRKAEQEKE